MNIYKILALLFLISISSFLFAAPIKKGDIIFASNFKNENNRLQWSKLNTAQWVNQSSANSTCLFINGSGMISTSLHLEPYRGMRLTFKCLVKAENVTKPSAPYLGVKYMLHYKSVTGEVFKNPTNIYGTFDWKEVSFTADIPNDVTNVGLYLGLQGSTGKVWFDSISVKVDNVPIPSTLRKLDITNSTTKFRGVMYPSGFDLKDIKSLSEDFNVNLIRWQLTMSSSESKSAGKDLQKYDDWINEKLKILDRVLVACQQYGIKVVIDLHSIPGGQNESGALNLFYNRQFNDHFISVWKTIASRYKENPTVWGYDLMNEPIQREVPTKGLDYISTQVRASEEIRNIDKTTAIIFEVGEGASPLSFVSLSPVTITNVIYSVHMYSPHSFTHQGVNDQHTGIVYPGKIDGIMVDKNSLKGILQPVRDFQVKYNVPIYVGEFSAIRWAPGAAQYLGDCIDIFEEYGWNWSYHAFREYDGWDVEYENGTNKAEKPKKASQETDRKKVLLKAFAKNKKP